MDNLKPSLEFPALGQRIVRTVVGIFLCYLVYLLIGDRGSVFLAIIAALQCIQTYMKNSFDMARIRFIGTLIGSAWGLGVVVVTHDLLNFNLLESVLGYLLVAVFTGVTIYSTVALNYKDVAGFSAFVFLSISAAPLGGQSPILFATHRLIDTMIGVAIAILVNAFHFPRDRNTDILFVSEIDNVMVGHDELKLTPYSKVELNYLLSHGIRFTISTWRTPASLLKVTEGLSLNLPVVVLGGAAIYDLEVHSYVETCPMTYGQARRITKFLGQYEIHCFANVVVDDTLLIYFQGIGNEAEQKMYDELKGSPHRNYINRELPEGEDVVCLTILDRGDKIEKAFGDLNVQPWAKEYRLETYYNGQHPGYKVLKIYHKDASYETMLGKIMKMIGVDRMITFGTDEHDCDVVIEDPRGDSMVKKLRDLFEPVHFTFKNIFRRYER